MQNVHKARSTKTSANRFIAFLLATTMFSNLSLFAFASGSVRAESQSQGYEYTTQDYADNDEEMELTYTNKDEEMSPTSAEETEAEMHYGKALTAEESQYNGEDEQILKQLTEVEVKPESESTTNEIDDLNDDDTNVAESEDEGLEQSTKSNNNPEETDAEESTLSADSDEEQTDKDEDYSSEDDMQFANNSEMMVPHTVASLLKTNPNTQAISAVIDYLVTNGCVPIAALMASMDSVGGVTFFAPSNSAIMSLAGDDATASMSELLAMLGKPDELCQLVSTHLHVGTALTAEDFQAEVTLISNQSNDDGLNIALVNEVAMVDQAAVTIANLEAKNGYVHVIDTLLLPVGPATIDAVVTDSTSPSISGTISVENPEKYVHTEDQETTGEDSADTNNEVVVTKHLPGFCVEVRIDGSSYDANVSGLDWSIDEGVVELDPLKSETLFTVVVRKAHELMQAQQMNVESAADAHTTEVTMLPEEACAPMSNSDANGDLPETETDDEAGLPQLNELVGITMQKNVLSFAESTDPETTKPEVLGTTDETEDDQTDDNNQSEVDESVVAAGSAGKGGFAPVQVAQTDPTLVDSDGDGVVDSVDTEPNNPNVTGIEDTDGDGVIDSEDPEPNNPDVTGQESDEDDDAEVETETSNLLWWFVGGGAAITLWYLLWQRGGFEE